MSRSLFFACCFCLQILSEKFDDSALALDAKFAASIVNNTEYVCCHPFSPSPQISSGCCGLLRSGAALIKKMETFHRYNQYIPASITVLANSCTRAVFAALLHHTDRLKVARLDATSALSNAPHLLVTRCWQKAIQIRAVLSQLKASGGDYAQFAADLCGPKTTLMLSLHPAALADQPSAAVAATAAAVAAGTRPVIGGPKFTRTPSALAREQQAEAKSVAATKKLSARWRQVKVLVQSMRFSFRAVWRLKRLIQYSLTTANADTDQDISATVFRFAQDQAVQSDVLLQSGLIVQRARALNRLAVFSYLQRLLAMKSAGVGNSASLPQFLEYVGDALRFESVPTQVRPQHLSIA